jgi:ribosome recycling factor
MINEVIDDARNRMQGAITSLHGDLAGFRTGRANTALLDRLTIEMFGTESPLNHYALVSVPEPQQLAIRPFDPSYLGAIERAIIKSDLGMMPNNDGKIIRLNIPRLTQERRIKLSKQIGNRVEEARVAVRNVRRDAKSDIEEMQQESMISEDELHGGLDRLQKLTDEFIKAIDKLGKEKEAEIMEV